MTKAILQFSAMLCAANASDNVLAKDGLMFSAVLRAAKTSDNVLAEVVFGGCVGVRFFKCFRVWAGAAGDV